MNPLPLSTIISRLRRAIRVEPGRDAYAAPPTTHPRFTTVPLPPSVTLETPLIKAASLRRSALAPLHGTMPLTHLSTILEISMKEKGGRRPYPSGGASYLLDAYIFPFRVETLPIDTHHYRADLHALEALWPLPGSAAPQNFLYDEINVSKNAPALIVLIANWGRATPTYGAYALELALIEAGHIAQNIALVAAALGLQCRTYGGYKADTIRSALELQDTDREPVYAIALGYEIPSPP